MHCLRIPEVARRLGVHKRTIFRLISEGKLRRIQVSPRLVYVEATSLEETFGKDLIRRAFPELYESEPKEVE